MRRTITGFAICLALAGIAAAQQSDPPQDKFIDRLLKNRYQLKLQDGKLSGPALPVLQSALSGAQFVLIGEDHGISQIPQFAGAVCDMVSREGFHTLAVEAGPLAARELRPWIERDDGPSRLVEFEKKYPQTIAFYNFQEEFDFLRHCARSAQGSKFQLWGLDQELMGASGLILTRILETHPGKTAGDEVRRLLQKSDEAHAAAIKSGSPGHTFMITSSEDELNRLRDLLRREGTPVSQSLIDALIVSRDIYLKKTSTSKI